MHCDMCGQKTQQYKALIEGSTMLVCSDCAVYGKIQGKITTPSITEKKRIKEKPEVTEVLVENFSEIIRKKREALQQNHEEFSKCLGVKISILHKIETRQFTPDLETAQRFERVLGIKLIETREETTTPQKSQKSLEHMTIGDFINVRKRSS